LFDVNLTPDSVLENLRVIETFFVCVLFHPARNLEVAYLSDICALHWLQDEVGLIQLCEIPQPGAQENRILEEFVVSTLSKEQLMERLKPVLKQKGFKKTKATSRKSTDDLLYLF
jgi:hypothetical protein